MSRFWSGTRGDIREGELPAGVSVREAASFELQSGAGARGIVSKDLEHLRAGGRPAALAQAGAGAGRAAAAAERGTDECGRYPFRRL